MSPSARSTDCHDELSACFVLAATITGGKLGTTETGGTTDFARWLPIAEVPSLEPRADVIDVALNVLASRD